MHPTRHKSKSIFVYTHTHTHMNLQTHTNQRTFKAHACTCEHDAIWSSAQPTNSKASQTPPNPHPLPPPPCHYLHGPFSLLFLLQVGFRYPILVSCMGVVASGMRERESVVIIITAIIRRIILRNFHRVLLLQGVWAPQDTR